MRLAGKTIIPSLVSQWGATAYIAVVSLGLTFVLGRVMGPSVFGTYSYILTLASLFFILQDGGFKTLLFREKTAPTPELAGYKEQLLPMALGNTVLATLLGLFLVLSLPIQNRAGIFTAIICFGLHALVHFLSSELKARDLFPKEAQWRAIVRTLGALGMLAGLFLIFPRPWCVFLGWSLGLIIAVLFCSPQRLSRPVFKKSLTRDIRKATLAFMAIDAATTIYYRSDIILLKYLSDSTAEVGYYAAAYRFLDGIVVFAAPLCAIWFRRLRLVKDDKREFYRKLLGMNALLLAAAIVIAVLGIFWNLQIMTYTFGSGYAPAAGLLSWLLAALVFVLPNGILTQAAIARNIQNLYALAAGIGAAVNICLNIYLIPLYGGLGAAWSTLATEASLTMVLLIALWRARSA